LLAFFEAMSPRIDGELCGRLRLEDCNMEFSYSHPYIVVHRNHESDGYLVRRRAQSYFREKSIVFGCGDTSQSGPTLKLDYPRSVNLLSDCYADLELCDGSKLHVLINAGQRRQFTSVPVGAGWKELSPILPRFLVDRFDSRSYTEMLVELLGVAPHGGSVEIFRNGGVASAEDRLRAIVLALWSHLL